jgi:hypothetical protein
MHPTFWSSAAGAPGVQCRLRIVATVDSSHSRPPDVLRGSRQGLYTLPNLKTGADAGELAQFVGLWIYLFCMALLWLWRAMPRRLKSIEAGSKQQRIRIAN